MTVFDEASKMHDCGNCNDNFRRMWHCPDWGLTDPKPRPLGAGANGKGGMEFDQCPGFWRRYPDEWGDVPHAADTNRTAGSLAYDIRYALDKGTADLLTLPGKAREAAVLLLGLEADKMRNDTERMQREADQKKGIRRV